MEMMDFDNLFGPQPDIIELRAEIRNVRRQDQLE
jgi:hypothetical protein